MGRNTTASQLLLFSIKHTVSGLARPQEQGVCVCICVCVQDHKNVALWRAVKGAVNLEEEGAGSRPTHTKTRLLGGGWETDHNRRAFTDTHTHTHAEILATLLVLGVRAAMRSYSSIFDWSMSAFSSQVESS